MILEKLSKIELETEYNINNEYRRIATIRSVKELLKQIDFSAEVIPLDDHKRLTELLISLKGRSLNKCEIKLVKELVLK